MEKKRSRERQRPGDGEAWEGKSTFPASLFPLGLTLVGPSDCLHWGRQAQRENSKQG